MKHLLVIILFGILLTNNDLKQTFSKNDHEIYNKKNYFFLKKDSIYGYEFVKIYIYKKDSSTKFLQFFPDSTYKFLFASRFIVSGKINGPGENFFIPNSNKITSLGNYKDGKLHGETKWFDSNGKIKTVEVYKNGRLISKYYPD